MLAGGWAVSQGGSIVWSGRGARDAQHGVGIGHGMSEERRRLVGLWPADEESTPEEIAEAITRAIRDASRGEDDGPADDD
jgi:hypothetical protein